MQQPLCQDTRAIREPNGRNPCTPKSSGTDRRHPRAIRLYETQGLIPPPLRQGRYRVYNDTEVTAIALIKRAQEAGFTLAELRSFINTKVQENRFPLELARELILRKRSRLDEEMKALKLTQRKLESLEQEIETRYA